MSKPVLQGWFSFSGRRNRRSYFLFQVLFWVILLVAFAMLMGEEVYAERHAFDGGGGNPVLMLIVLCVTLVMTFCHALVSAQRFRDFGWTGWGILLFLVPVVGFIAAIVLLVMPGTQGANRHGEDPLR